MAKKFRTMRTFARTASKSMEKNLVENAKQLSKNPYLILPEYNDNVSEKYFKKIRKSLDKVARFKDDTKKLEKLSNKKGLDGALAGTLLLSHSEKAPYLAVIKFPTGDITYAQRGKADREKLVAVQHFDDPVIRLLGIKDVVLKKKLYAYSWPDGFISTGEKPSPPQGFIDFVIKKTDFVNKNRILSCGHIKEEDVLKKSSSNKYYLRIHWKSADKIFAICQDCARNTKNTMFKITQYLLEPNLSDDFEIEIIGQVFKQEKTNFETVYLDDYLSGEISDYDLINKNKKEREDDVKQSGEKLFVLDGKSFGTDVQGFVDALKPRAHEEKGLLCILEKVEEPVVLKNVTPNKVLEMFWKKHGLDAISMMLYDEKMAKKFYELDEPPSDILELVSKYGERQEILSKLPQYSSLPPLASFIDHVAKTYKTFGEKEAISEVKKRPDTPKGKSVAYAFLIVFGKSSEKWKFSKVEIEYGEFLKDYVKKLLDSSPKNYHKCLQELLVASGSSETVDDKII